MQIELLAMTGGTLKQAETSSDAEVGSETGQASFHNVISELTARHQSSDGAGAQAPGSDGSPAGGEPPEADQEPMIGSLPVITDNPVPSPLQVPVVSSPMPAPLPGNVEPGTSPVEQNLPAPTMANQVHPTGFMAPSGYDSGTAGETSDLLPSADQRLPRQIELSFSPSAGEVSEQSQRAHQTLQGDTGVDAQPARPASGMQKPVMPGIKPGMNQPVPVPSAERQTVSAGDSIPEPVTEKLSLGTKNDSDAGPERSPSQPPPGAKELQVTNDSAVRLEEGIADPRSAGAARAATPGTPGKADRAVDTPGEVAPRAQSREVPSSVPSTGEKPSLQPRSGSQPPTVESELASTVFSNGEKLSRNPQTLDRDSQNIGMETADGWQKGVPNRTAVPPDSGRPARDTASDSRRWMAPVRRDLVDEAIPRPAVSVRESLVTNSTRAKSVAPDGIVPADADPPAAGSMRAEGEPSPQRSSIAGRGLALTETGPALLQGMDSPPPELKTASQVHSDDVEETTPLPRRVAEHFATEQMKQDSFRTGQGMEETAAREATRKNPAETSQGPGTIDMTKPAETTAMMGMDRNPSPFRQSQDFPMPVSRGVPPLPLRALGEAAPTEMQQNPVMGGTADPAAGISKQLNLPLEPPQNPDHERVPEAAAAREVWDSGFSGPKMVREGGETIQMAEGLAKSDVGTVPGWAKSTSASISQGELPMVQTEAARVRNPEFLFRIADRIRAKLMQGSGVIRIQLKPSMLGRLEIQAQTATSNVSATIRAESQSVKEYLEANLHILQKGLQDQGFKIDRLHFAVMDDSGPNGWNQQDAPGSRTPQEGRASREKGPWTAKGSEEEEEMTVDAAMLAVLAPHSTFHTVA